MFSFVGRQPNSKHSSSASTSSKLSTVEISSIVERLRTQSHRDSTRYELLQHLESFQEVLLEA